LRIFYDTEFLDDGERIMPISIAMHREDGSEYYAINNSRFVLLAALRHGWLREHVVPQLPITVLPSEPMRKSVSFNPQSEVHRYVPNLEHPDYHCLKPINAIAGEVQGFITGTPAPELWADYAAYDHVLLAQLFGPMIRLPQGVPMFTNEFRTFLLLRDNPHIPKYVVPAGSAITEHHPLYDARELAFRHQYVSKLWNNA
jgi:hypothetical protein